MALLMSHLLLISNSSIIRLIVQSRYWIFPNSRMTFISTTLTGVNEDH